jgi:hypothetical protein
MSGIRLSKKHGLNPSVTHCFYCHKAVGVALFGVLRDDAEAPRECVADMTPCDECREWMRQGVILIEVRDGAGPTIDPYRTGGRYVVREDAIRRIFDAASTEKALRGRWSFISAAAAKMIGLRASAERVEE